MARRDDYVPVEVKRTVRQQAHGVCQYRDCPTELTGIDPASGELWDRGEYGHILPVGDGPRAGYKLEFPLIDVHSAANLIYLCPGHHQLIDQINPEQHPPHILFRMKAEKYTLFRESITEVLARQAEIQTAIEGYIKEYDLHAVTDLFYRARVLGPSKGTPVFQDADRLMRSLLANVFIKRGDIGRFLLITEYQFSRLFIFYSSLFWREAFDHVSRALRIDLPDALVFHLLSCSMTLVRDEYGTFDTTDKLALISQLIRTIDKKLVGRTDPGIPAFLLLTKSALLRWRGRFERGPNQRKTYGEAQRCCDKSYELVHNPGSMLQSVLINYSQALAFPLRESPKHEPFFEKCFGLLEAPEMVGFPPAIKYRPRVYRDTYRFADSIDSFWKAADLYRSEFHRIAYLVGEAAVGEHYHTGYPELDHVSDAHSILSQAIQEGYCHGRNVAAYINCRGVLEPDWFEAEILDKLFDGEDHTVPWQDILTRVRNALYIPTGEHDEPSFGIDEGEFWNTIGGLTGRTLDDHPRSIRLLQIAEQHAEVSGGRFRAYVGLARQYKQIGDLTNYKHYLNQAWNVGRAHQATIISQLENL